VTQGLSIGRIITFFASEGLVSEGFDMEDGGIHMLSVALSMHTSLGFGLRGQLGPGFKLDCSGMASSWEGGSSHGLENDLHGLGDGCDSSDDGCNNPAGVSKEKKQIELTLKEILHSMHCGHDPSSLTPKLPLDSALELWKDHNKLKEVCATLTTKSKDPHVSIVLWTHLTGMVSVLNLYLDPQVQFTWREASLIVVRVQGSGEKKAWNLCKWILDFIQVSRLPSYKSGQNRWSILEDEDIKAVVQLKLMERAKGQSITARDIIDIVVSCPRLQECFSHSGITKPVISEHSAHHWLTTLEWQYGLPQKGMYVDGHEREDIVQYHQALIERWKQYEQCFHLWDNKGNLLPLPNGFPVPGAIGRFHLILVTHDESTFFQNDLQRSHWSHKGDGQSVMVSEFLTADWGHLCDGDESV